MSVVSEAGRPGEPTRLGRPQGRGKGGRVRAQQGKAAGDGEEKRLKSLRTQGRKEEMGRSGQGEGGNPRQQGGEG